MNLQRARMAAEGWARAKVGRAGEALVRHVHLDGIHPVRRKHQLRISCDVCRRNADRPAAALAVNDLAVDGKSATEQPFSTSQVGFLKRLANNPSMNDLAGDLISRDDRHIEAE